MVFLSNTLFLSGATPFLGSQMGTSAVPVFVSSLHCTDEEHSLLDDCAHSQLGLAVCDEDSGLAGAKCLGKWSYHFRITYYLLFVTHNVQVCKMSHESVLAF